MRESWLFYSYWTKTVDSIVKYPWFYACYFGQQCAEFGVWRRRLGLASQIVTGVVGHLALFHIPCYTNPVPCLSLSCRFYISTVAVKTPYFVICSAYMQCAACSMQLHLVPKRPCRVPLVNITTYHRHFMLALLKSCALFEKLVFGLHWAEYRENRIARCDGHVENWICARGNNRSIHSMA
ncbi:hypothetical protein M441DRAFT_424699 [Trichoderma asperellum CBS 433.97]|uniref:Uncharacterized protein n=1 Tax=Trichoderma asperellum (strain ATCC 204424 / CBS 433.97 / NBRC 101777) TaxID=1042311 RepID=A0A2T3Z5H3_TRIA4|nr:hypothetical protein M441DRAFT_424699 [Trichoderma asperellum CBS 433.97]PTB40000.1 hypothetical protein M441DRAFT_424699 [Trichoderma asperellum CBS 433.97]